MAEVIGVRFKRAGKVYYFDPDGIAFEEGDGVIVETIHGVEFANVATKRDIEIETLSKPLKKVIRKADEKDVKKCAENAEKEVRAFGICEEKIKEHGLEMKLISVEYTFDCKKIVFYFTADGRVDFRELVKDLASVFKTRIELRQIGVRDETKMIGGLGPCGRPACCAEFLGEFQPVSIKMAKEQSLSLSPTKISGLCGRLMCCLNYEHEYYESVYKRMPRNGSEVKTPDGKGSVIDGNALKQTVRVRIELQDGTAEAREYSIDDVRVLKKGKRRDEDKVEMNEEMKSLLDD